MNRTLFEAGRNAESPLAHRMRPRNLAEFIGQTHIIGHGRLLRRAIEADQLSSLLFFGPPGVGKTTLAMVIAETTASHFMTLNAVLSGVKRLREAIAVADEQRRMYGKRTTLFVDEVHRWNKAQQDALLPHVENGTVLLIGATTANPYFEVQPALVSRSRIFQLLPLTAAELRQVADQALTDSERGYGKLTIDLHTNALDHLINVANGDARSLLNALELAVETTPPDADEGAIVIDLAVAEESIQRRAVLYDKDGDAHYDTISAFIKSIRGSDPDAALYWAAKMVYAGEDPRFIFRRLGILASEDVGLADPNAAVIVHNCWQLFERLGMPEGQFPLAQAVLYLATAPKSNTTMSFFDALRVVEAERQTDVPLPLKDGKRDAAGLGHGVGYKYPHAYQNHWVAQQYLPTSLQGRVFYQPSDQGYEQTIAADVLRRREAQLAVLAEAESEAVVLTASPEQRGRDAWLNRTLSTSGQTVGTIRDHLFDRASLQRHHLVLDLTAHTGLLLWEAVRRAPEGGVWGVVAPFGVSDEVKEEKKAQLIARSEPLPALDRPDLITTLDQLESTLTFDRLIAYNPLTYLMQQAHVVSVWHDWLAEDGLLLIAQTVPRHTQRIHALVDWTGAAALGEQVAVAEESLWTDPDNPQTAWDIPILHKTLTDAGWQIDSTTITLTEQRRLGRSLITRWFTPESPYHQTLVAHEIDVAAVQARYEQQLADALVNWTVTVALIRCNTS